MAKLFEPPQYIAVEGPIRVGKSTLANIIADRLNAQRVIEPEDNAFLSSFYEGERGAAFQTQFAFMIRRFEQLQKLEVGGSSQKLIVADYIFEKDKIFAYINLTDQELDIYNRYYHHFHDQLPVPDLVIYFRRGLQVNHQIGDGELIMEMMIITVVNVQLLVSKVDVGENFIFFKNVVGDNQLLRTALHLQFLQLLETANHESELGL